MAVQKACKNAFRIGTAKPLYSTHVVFLEYDFDERVKGGPAKQLTLREAKCLTHLEMENLKGVPDGEDRIFNNTYIYSQKALKTDFKMGTPEGMSLIRMPCLHQARSRKGATTLHYVTVCCRDIRDDLRGCLDQYEKIIPDLFPPADYDWVGAYQKRLEFGKVRAEKPTNRLGDRIFTDRDVIERARLSHITGNTEKLLETEWDMVTIIRDMHGWDGPEFSKQEMAKQGF